MHLKYSINGRTAKALGLPRFDTLKNEYVLNEEVEKRTNGRKSFSGNLIFLKYL